MQRLVDEVEGGWSKLFKSLFVTAKPKEEVKKTIMKSNLSDIDKKALIKSLDKVDDMGKNIFSYEKEENNNNRPNAKRQSKNQVRKQDSRNKIENVEKQPSSREDIDRGIRE